MIDALISGKVYGQPQQKTSKAGKPFTVAKIKTAIGNDEAVFVNVICFKDDVGRALLALGDGDSVSLAGSLTPKVWTDKQGEARPALDLLVSALLTPYHIQRKRKAVGSGLEPIPAPASAEGLDDDVDF